MGEAANQPVQPSFNAAVKGEVQGSRIASGGGLILVGELDERLGFSDLIAQPLTDPRSTRGRCSGRSCGGWWHCLSPRSNGGGRCRRRGGHGSERGSGVRKTGGRLRHAAPWGLERTGASRPMGRRAKYG